jgi:hypothetical protein
MERNPSIDSSWLVRAFSEPNHRPVSTDFVYCTDWVRVLEREQFRLTSRHRINGEITTQINVRKGWPLR